MRMCIMCISSCVWHACRCVASGKANTPANVYDEALVRPSDHTCMLCMCMLYNMAYMHTCASSDHMHTRTCVHVHAPTHTHVYCMLCVCMQVLPTLEWPSDHGLIYATLTPKAKP